MHLLKRIFVCHCIEKLSHPLAVCWGHVDKFDAVAYVRMVTDNFGPGANLNAVQPQDDLHSGFGLEGVHHFEVATADTEVGG